MPIRPRAVLSLSLALVLAAAAAAGETLILRDPTIGGGNVVFAHGGDLWVVGLAPADHVDR